MPLRPTAGNMYEFITHTWNPIKGKCLHDCSYCYMKRFPQRNVRLDEKELITNLGEGKFIFVGSGTDMFADNIPSSWIHDVIFRCKKFSKNRYFFQTKNPDEMRLWLFPQGTVLCITLESSIEQFPHMGNAPTIESRVRAFSEIRGYEKMVTIEPVMDFDLEYFVLMLRQINPIQVNIGADSKNSNLPEPDPGKLNYLIAELRTFTHVVLKKNLKRLCFMNG